MIDIGNQNIYYDNGFHSSKGDQLKTKVNEIWYKADRLGYESLSEILISNLLKKTSIPSFVNYSFEQIRYQNRMHNACKSQDFLSEKERLITCEHIFFLYTGESLAQSMARHSIKDKISMMVSSIEEITGMSRFGEYITSLLEIDALFLNEDRHTNNIAIIRNEETGLYLTSPVFDNGAALFSDTFMDYPIDMPVEECIRKIEAKPFDTDFDKQLEAAESLYGVNLSCRFSIKDVLEILDQFKNIYDERIIRRIEETMRWQMRKYQYMFG